MCGTQDSHSFTPRFTHENGGTLGIVGIDLHFWHKHNWDNSEPFTVMIMKCLPKFRDEDLETKLEYEAHVSKIWLAKIWLAQEMGIRCSKRCSNNPFLQKSMGQTCDSCSQLMIACQQKNGCHKLIQHLVRQNDVEAVAAILRSTVPPFAGGNKASELAKHGKPSITGLEAPKSKPPFQSQ